VLFSVPTVDIYSIVFILGGCILIGAAFFGFILDFVDEMRNSFSK
jgi:hypothetical protein